MFQLGDKIDNEMPGRSERGLQQEGAGEAKERGKREVVASKMENRLRACRLQHARVS